MEKEKRPICTIVLAVINTVIFLGMEFMGMTGSGADLLKCGAAYTPYIIENGEYYRMFTSMFLHFDFSHFMNNMVVLLVLGSNLEPIVGKMKILLIYILSGMGGNLISMLTEMFFGGIFEGYAVSAGASGAIFGLTGALLCLAIRNWGRVGNVTKQQMFLMAGISLYLGFASAGVDNAAHVGGLLTGMLAALLLVRKRNPESCPLMDD